MTYCITYNSTVTEEEPVKFVVSGYVCCRYDNKIWIDMKIILKNSKKDKNEI